MKTNLLLGLSLLLVACSVQEQQTTNNKKQNAFSAEGKTISVYTTTKDNDKRLANGEQLTFTKSIQPLESEVAVFINPDKQFQSFLGMGGAITDASAEVFAMLPEDKQAELLNAYYGADGIDYTLLRTTIHSCDFASGSYTYIEEGDKELKTFSIEHDQQYRIPI